MRKLWAAGAAIAVCLALGVPALAQDASPVPAQDEVLYEITVPLRPSRIRARSSSTSGPSPQGPMSDPL